VTAQKKPKQQLMKLQKYAKLNIKKPGSGRLLRLLAMKLIGHVLQLVGLHRWECKCMTLKGIFTTMFRNMLMHND